MTAFPRRRVLMAAGAFLVASKVAPVHAADWPERPIRVLVGYSAGGGADTMARLVAARLSAVLGQQVVVENRAGAAGLVAADAVANAPADGYTLMVGDSSMLIAKYMQPKLGFDPIKSFAPISGLVKTPLMVVANNDFPAKTPKELVTALKAKPGFYSFATAGVGTVQHLSFEMLKGQTGTFVPHIPYRGAAQIVPDVISGHVPLGVITATAAMAHAKSGKLRALAMMSKDVLPGTENVLAVTTAVAGIDVAPRLFLLAPARTPSAIVDKISEATRAVIGSADFVSAAAAQGGISDYMSPAQLAVALSEELTRWGTVIRERKISNE